jgi:hypothetical protein
VDRGNNASTFSTVLQAQTSDYSLAKQLQ